MPQDLGAAGHIGEEWADGFRLSGIETGCQKIPIVLATAMWGRQCNHKHVLIKFYCDNMAAVQIMASKISKEQGKVGEGHTI